MPLRRLVFRLTKAFIAYTTPHLPYRVRKMIIFATKNAIGGRQKNELRKKNLKI